MTLTNLRIMCKIHNQQIGLYERLRRPFEWKRLLVQSASIWDRQPNAEAFGVRY